MALLSQFFHPSLYTYSLLCVLETLSVKEEYISLTPTTWSLEMLLGFANWMNQNHSEPLLSLSPRRLCRFHLLLWSSVVPISEVHSEAAASAWISEQSRREQTWAQTIARSQTCQDLEFKAEPLNEAHLEVSWHQPPSVTSDVAEINIIFILNTGEVGDGYTD